MPVSLADRLKDLIRREGPVTFHDWMQAALYDAAGGYYQRSDLKRWGREGDYRTSPERSELFAATFARYFNRLYEELGRPVEWSIVECGAGEGCFAAGVLRTLSDQFAEVFAATRYVVCESSEDARRRAKEKLEQFSDRVEFCSELPQVKSGVYFSNELLDAFPVHRVINDDYGLRELYVNVAPSGEFEWFVGPLSTPRLAEFCHEYSLQLAARQIIEINLEVENWLAEVAQKLERGFLITVDYGAEAAELYDAAHRPQGTLRAFSRHGFVDDVLAQPGDYDITTTVNWTHVKKVGAQLGLEIVEFTSQDRFLLNAGLLEQLEFLLSKAGTEADRVSLTTGAREMILPGGMASSFQVLVQKRGL